jgi:hypothetical protein
MAVTRVATPPIVPPITLARLMGDGGEESLLLAWEFWFVLVFGFGEDAGEGVGDWIGVVGL